MRLNKKDRKLIAQHHTGKALLKRFPKLKGPLSMVFPDENIQNIVVGAVSHGCIGLLSQALLGNSLANNRAKRQQEYTKQKM